MFNIVPKSLIKCLIRVGFVIEIIFTSEYENICVDFKKHMTNIAKHNSCLQHLQLKKIHLNREYRQKNKKKIYFNQQKIILERDSSALKSFFESSIGFILNNLLAGLDDVNFFIKSEPIIYETDPVIHTPTKHYYCSNIQSNHQSLHKKNFLNQIKHIKNSVRCHIDNDNGKSKHKNKKYKPKIVNKLCSTGILNSDLYSDEEEFISQAGTHQLDNLTPVQTLDHLHRQFNEQTHDQNNEYKDDEHGKHNATLQASQRRVSNRIKYPITRLNY
jgi:hypothetical protein